MNKSTPIFILIGPPAVGKSTTSRALAARFKRSVHISVDDLREMVVSGLLLPSAVWSAQLAEQIAIARKNTTQMTENYQSADFCVVVDDFWDANFLPDYHELLSQPSVHKILLYPPQETAHQRNYVRSDGDETRVYIDDGIRIVYDQLKDSLEDLIKTGWLIVDTSEMSVEETVDYLLNTTIN